MDINIVIALRALIVKHTNTKGYVDITEECVSLILQDLHEQFNIILQKKNQNEPASN